MSPNTYYFQDSDLIVIGRMRRALMEWENAFDRIRNMTGWKEDEADLWAAPELYRASDATRKVLDMPLRK